MDKEEQYELPGDPGSYLYAKRSWSWLLSEVNPLDL